MKKLPIGQTLKEGIALGAENALRIIAATLLYLITIWIPYINVGTTIAMCALPAEIAKGNRIDPLSIFESKYRRNMGEFFILMTLMSGAICFGFLFGFFPGVVIAFAWTLADILFVDKDLSAIDALHESNRLTYGNKWRIFWITMLLVLIFYAVIGAFSCLLLWEITWLEVVAVCLIVLVSILLIPMAYGIDAVVYRELTAEPKEEEQPAPAEPAAE